MKIVNIVPGFGGTFYCGNCLRDSAFASSLKQAGHQAMVIPVYLPLTMNNYVQSSEVPVFYGAVNIYLKQSFKFLHHMPAWMERFFNSPSILKYAAKKAGSTRATGLEDMTESMLLGKDGRQNEELQILVDYLKHHEKPDVVHLSNALLLGMAKQIRDEVNVPVVCSLQDEDVWLDAMEEPHRTRLWNLMTEKGKDADAFIAVSDFYAKVMKQKMNIPDEKLHVIHIGINPSLYDFNPPASNPQTIGFLSRMNHENGFEIFVDALIELKRNPTFKNLKMKASGGKTGDDKKFFNQQMKKLKQNNLLDDVEIIEDFSLPSLKEFFKTLTTLSVPVINGEAFGLYQIEALASGVPLVQPAVGAFPEIIETSGGGVCYQPNTSSMLAKALTEVLSSEEKLKLMSLNGRESVIKNFDCTVLTSKMTDIYKKVIDLKK